MLKQCFNCGAIDTLKRPPDRPGFPLCEDCFEAEYPDLDWIEGVEQDED